MITADEARSLFDYDEITGIIRWRSGRKNNQIKAGDIAGHKRKDGYIHIHMKERAYFAHRLVWLIVHGEWPINHIDHINLAKDDNRLANLRQATRSQNASNTRARSFSGFKGVYWYPRSGKWNAQIRKGYRLHNLGYFLDARSAADAYSSAARELHGEFARVGTVRQ